MPGQKRSASAHKADSRKRSASVKSNGGKKRRAEEDAAMVVEEDEFEDDFSDEIEDEEPIPADGSDEEDMDMDEDAPQQRAVFRPGIDEMPEGAEMTYDSAAYDMYHKLELDWPCLSFDIVTDAHGAARQKYPLTCYFACGSQAAGGEENYVGIMKGSQLCRTRFDGDEDEDPEVDPDEEEDDDDEDNDLDPILESKLINDSAPFNRIRCMPQQPTIMAAWSELGSVKIWDYADQYKQLDNPAEWVRENAARGGAKAGAPPPLLFTTPHSREGHTIEGFGLGWSPVKRGCLATGDCEGQIRVWSLTESGSISASNLTPNAPAPGSVEDIKWSSIEENAFICCMAGGDCQVYDPRSPGAKMSWVGAPGGVDVNVLDWNPHVKASRILATGNDDGSFHLWDLKMIRQAPKMAKPIQTYTFLNAPITSVEWNPTNENLLAVASDDNQVTLWDFSVERDREEEAELAARHPELAKFPAQLMFQHMGLSSPKELHWHPQIPGTVLVTDAHGIDIFRPANWRGLIR